MTSRARTPKGATAYPTLWSVCLPHEETLVRNAVVSGSFLGYTCGTTLMLRSARLRDGRPLITTAPLPTSLTTSPCRMVAGI